MLPVHVRVTLHGAQASAWVRCRLEKRDAVDGCVVHQEFVQHIWLLDTVFARYYLVSMYLSPSLMVH